MDFTLKASPSSSHNRTKSCFNGSFKKETNPTAAKIKDMTQFIICEKIGQGTFASVRLGTHILTSEQVAIKILDKTKIKDNKDKNRIEREISVLKTLLHPNIVQLYTVITTPISINLIQEYIKGRNFSDYLASRGRLEEDEACKYFQQLISAVEYIHKNKVSHRDLKPENVIITKEKDLKILDFGLSNFYYGKTTLLETPCGSPYYAAPEMLQGNEYSGICVDIWSCGIILFVMLCGFLPFDADTHLNLYKKIINGKFVMPNYLSKLAKDFIGKILVTNPKKRFKTSQIKAHPWFNLKDKTNNYYKGIDLKSNIIPIDENIVKEMETYGYDKKEVRENVLSNARNHISTSYYLLLKKKVRQGEDSVSYFKSPLYYQFILDPTNQLSYYNNDLAQVIKQRSSSKKDDEKEIIITDNNKEIIQTQQQKQVYQAQSKTKPNKKKDQFYKKQNVKKEINKFIHINSTLETPISRINIKTSGKVTPSCRKEFISPRDTRQLSLSIDKHTTPKTQIKKSFLKYPSKSTNTSLETNKKMPSSMVVTNKNKTPISSKHSLENINSINSTPRVRIGLYKHCLNINRTSIKHKILKCTPQNANKTLRHTNTSNHKKHNVNYSTNNFKIKQQPLTSRDGNSKPKYRDLNNSIKNRNNKNNHNVFIDNYNTYVKPKYNTNIGNTKNVNLSYTNNFGKSVKSNQSKETDHFIKQNYKKKKIIENHNISNGFISERNSLSNGKKIKVKSFATSKPLTANNSKSNINNLNKQ